MKEVTFLERLAERLLEGGFVRALKPRLQPVQIAKALAREMERSQVVGPEGPLVANDYLASLHPDDLAAFSEFRGSLERELSAYLRDYAARHGLRTLAPPVVALAPADPPGPRGRVAVKASLLDPPLEPASVPTGTQTAWEGTVIMPVAAPLERAPEVAPEPDEAPTELPVRPIAFLVDEMGNRFALNGAVTAIGRAVDNDIVLEMPGVSRHHARILWEPGSDRYVLLDLESTNGSFVSGRRVTNQPLSGGEQISFGGALFTFELSGSH